MEQHIIDKILARINPEKAKEFKKNLPEASDFLNFNSSEVKKRIGEILIQRNKISEEQLKEALDEQNDGASEKLGEILLKKQFINDRELLQSLAEQLNLPYFDDLPFNEIDPELVTDISRGFCKQYCLIPVSKDRFGVTVAVCDPLNLDPIDDLRLILATTIYRVVCPKDLIESAIQSVFEKKDIVGSSLANEGEEGDDLIEGLGGVADLLEDEDEAPIRREVNYIIRKAISDGASDIHIEPVEDRLIVRCRLDGRLREFRQLPKKMQSGITTCIKIYGKADISESRVPLDGLISIKVGQKPYDLRLSTLPTKWGERIVMRIQPKNQGILALSDLGMRNNMEQVFRKLIKQKHGIILVTGPTGSGKTNTLASAISILNNPDTSIITIEDPVEIQIPGVSQVEVAEKAGLTFAKALRSILRQDPEIILLQEIRDTETAQISIQAASTGHLILSTLHTNDACSAVTRLTDLGVENYQIASTVLGVLAQRLLAKLCPTCKKPAAYTESELETLGLTEADAAGKKLYKRNETGCTECRNTGYKGRNGIFELLIINDVLKKQIMESADSVALKKIAHEQGIMTLKESAAQLFLDGITDLQEAVRSTQDEEVV